MSKNVSRLSGRKGLDDNLFERIVRTGTDAAAHRQLAREYLLGEAVTLGAASFYDLLSETNTGKKALVCDGSACLCAGTQADLADRLAAKFGADKIGKITCLGRCHENSAFHLDGCNYSGNAIDDLDAIAAGAAGSSDSYHTASTLATPLLLAEFPGLEPYYRAFTEGVLKQPPAAIIETIKSARLRGRGGAGFPAGMKWEACAQAPGAKKYIVCNADEGDPGAYIDRWLMEARPHSVLFGMMTAGYAIGADEGVLYVRAEYPESIRAVNEAVDELRAHGLLGTAIAGTGFAFDFKVIAGAGAYICGEETALLASLEGRRPEVSIRPPYPTTEGLFGKPTAVNNVETLANIYSIVTSGSETYAALGTSGSTGPKLLSLDGQFNRPGLYEVAMGTPLLTVIEDLGQGFRRPVKALQIGGPLGGIVPADRFADLTIDFESFRDGGFLLGHGSIVSIPTDFPIIKYLEHLMEFCAFESCGKCFPCRLGSMRGQEMLSAAAHGGPPIDRQLFDDLLETMALGSLCAHGGGIPLPIRNALQYFDDELKPYFQR